MLIKEQCSSYYGTAGRAWVEALAITDKRQRLIQKFEHI